MKLLKSLLALCLMAAPGLSFAGLNLPAPQALLAKASQNRIALREVIMDMDLNISEMRDPATFESYFFLMDDLQNLAIQFKLDDYYPQAVQGLGLRMASNGMRWLDTTRTTPDVMKFYVNWMDAETLARLLGLVEYQVDSVKEPARLAVMAKNLESILPMVDQRAASLPYVQLGFRRLLSDAAVNILKTPGLNQADVQFWMSKIKLSSSAAEYLDFLNQGIYSLEASNKAQGHVFLSQTMMLNKQLASLSEAAPSWLVSAIGDSVVETILRMVRLEEQFVPNEFELALGSMRIRQLQGLAQQWMTQEKLPGKGYVAHYLELSRLLVEKTRSVGLAKDSDDLAKWLARTAAPVLAKHQDLEGRYLLKDSTGREFYFTIAAARENILVAALGDLKGWVYKPFYNVTYNVNGGFVASEREPDLDNDQNHPVKFEMDSEGVMTVIDLFSRRDAIVLKGKKVASLPDMWKTAQPEAPSADGFYEGKLPFPDGTTRMVRVTVSSFNGYTLGRLDGEGLTIDFNLGSKGLDGVLLLTSGRSSGGTWVQLRANVTAEGLMTYVLIGGRGENPTPTLLKRVKR